MVLLFALLVIAAKFGLDVVLGAFLAGVVLRRWTRGDVQSLAPIHRPARMIARLLA
jgi:Kef-type K+ transport system membrane component KefB